MNTSTTPVPALALDAPAMTAQPLAALGAVGAGLLATTVFLALDGISFAGTVSACVFGGTLALTVWLLTDSVLDRARRARVHEDLNRLPVPRWAWRARDVCVGNPRTAASVRERWEWAAVRRSWERYAAANAAVALGCVASFFRLTPERVSEERFLVIALPALLGGLAWAAALADVPLRVTRWHDIYRQWEHWVAALAANADLPEPLSASGARPGAEREPRAKPKPAPVRSEPRGLVPPRSRTAPVPPGAASDGLADG